jgi:NADH-quinone oxidoreductase subunit N
MTSHDLLVLAVPLATGLAACAVLVADLLLPSERRHWTGGIAATLLLCVLGLSFVTDDAGTLTGGIYVASAATQFLQRLFLAASVLGILGGLAHVARLTRLRQGEYYFLLLCSVLGMTLLPGARDLILLLIAFELMGLPLYALAAFEKVEGPQGAEARGRAAEAGLKLYLVGAASTCGCRTRTKRHRGRSWHSSRELRRPRQRRCCAGSFSVRWDSALQSGLQRLPRSRS